MYQDTSYTYLHIHLTIYIQNAMTNAQCEACGRAISRGLKGLPVGGVTVLCPQAVSSYTLVLGQPRKVT